MVVHSFPPVAQTIPEIILLEVSYARVGFGVAFSIKFLSSSAFLGFRKALEQDVMSSLVTQFLQPGYPSSVWPRPGAETSVRVLSKEEKKKMAQFLMLQYI